MIRARRFLSLKWKAVGLLTAVLIAVNGVFTVWNDATLRQQYQADRHIVRERQAEVVELLNSQILRQLEHVAGSLPTTAGVRPAMERRDSETLRLTIEPYWSRLNVDQGLEGAVFFDAGGARLETFGYLGGLDAMATHLGLRALQEERPQEGTFCAVDQCLTMFVLPVLGERGNAGAVLVAATLADVMASFRQITGSDLGFYLHGEGIAWQAEGAPGKSLRLLALTGGQEKQRILAAMPDLANSRRGHSVSEFMLDGRHWEAHAFRPRALRGTESLRFLAINDVTADRAAIRNALQNNLLVGTAGLVSSEIFLFLLLWIPLRRLDRVAHEMPQLGAGRFEQVRNSLEGRRRGWFSDELSMLEQSAVSLADRLEYLQAESERHNQELTDLVRQLSRERDFVSGLLDTAQVLILTQDMNGRILMANGLAQTLSGLRHENLVGRYFMHTMLMPEQVASMQNHIEALRNGRADVVQGESTLPCLDGAMRDIVWFHSRIGEGEGKDGVILSVGMDVTELRHARQKMSYLAENDTLTGLPNRAKFQRELDALLAGSSANQGALIVFDLDEFRAANELGGQRAGDRLLVLAASKLRDLQPRPASIGRLGSDDFAVFFTDIPPVQAIQVARLINAGFRMDADTRGSDELSACSGLALCPNHSRDAQELLSFANLALIQAKTKGRGSWHMYSPEELLREQALSKAQTVSLIDRALARDGFELHFQPIVSLTDKPSSHFEALVRMRDEHGSMVFPGLFIPVAEQTGQIRNIDRWVIRRAIKELAQQSEQLCLAVNLSGRSLGDSGLVNEIRQSLADSKVGPHRLILEITETTALAEIDAARELLSSLHELGCTIALDDFGVGFSSFQYLKQLPVDYVKIDGSFIRGLDKNEDDRVFVRALNEAVHGYGKRTIAEFVENAEILRLLKEYGVDFAQGYHLGKPRPELIYSSAGIFLKRA